MWGVFFSSAPSGNSQINGRQFLAGLLALAAGMSIYLVARPGNATYVAEFLSVFHEGLPAASRKIGVFVGSAPSFFHVLAFALLSMAVCTTRKARTLVCALWVFLNGVCETFQAHASLLDWMRPAGLATVSALERLSTLAGSGTFDISDLAATAVGGVAAFVTGELLTSGENSCHGEKERRDEINGRHKRPTARPIPKCGDHGGGAVDFSHASKSDPNSNPC